MTTLLRDVRPKQRFRIKGREGFRLDGMTEKGYVIVIFDGEMCPFIYGFPPGTPVELPSHAEAVEVA